MGRWNPAPWYDGHDIVDPCTVCAGSAFEIVPNHHEHCGGWTCEKFGCPVATEVPCHRCQGSGEEPEQPQEVLL